VTGAAAKKTMRKRFSAAKLALRKFSHGGSSPNIINQQADSNASTSLTLGLGSPTQEFSIINSDHLVDEATTSSAPTTAYESMTPPTLASNKSPTSRFFRNAAAVLRKVSSSTPPRSSDLPLQLNPKIEALKKQPLGPSLSWDLNNHLRLVILICPYSLIFADQEVRLPLLEQEFTPMDVTKIRRDANLGTQFLNSRLIFHSNRLRNTKMEWKKLRKLQTYRVVVIPNKL
jgi:hypothetical protein